MRILSLLLSAGIILLAASCGKLEYKKTPGGLVYKIFSDGKGDSVKEGYFVKYYVENKVNDSVYRSTFGGEPGYVQAMNPGGQKYDVSEIWTQMRKGDSVIIIQSLDTLMKKGIQLPPEIKKGDMLRITLKILDVYKDDAVLKAEQKSAADNKIISEQEAIKKYLAEKKIEGVQKTTSGVFVKIIDPGTGLPADSGKTAFVMYKGSSWSGVVFDSNLDSSFQHTDPLTFTIDGSDMIKGFNDGIKLLRKGGKAIIYIPSVLGYGAAGNPPKVQPNENLIFDVELIDVKDAAAVQQPVNIHKQ